MGPHPTNPPPFCSQVIDLSECYIRIELDRQRIADLHLGVDARAVKAALLSQPKLKLNPIDLIVESSAVLKVRPPPRARSCTVLWP